MIQPNSVQETILNFVKITNLKIWANQELLITRSSNSLLYLCSEKV
jgi:hypothetical protein